jgi:mRNA-degrading endonuclease toxin of MazEF toxin-antitoxin module
MWEGPWAAAIASKARPAVVVSNDAASATATRLGRGVVTVVPVTTDTARIYPCAYPSRGPGAHQGRADHHPGQALASRAGVGGEHDGALVVTRVKGPVGGSEA